MYWVNHSWINSWAVAFLQRGNLKLVRPAYRVALDAKTAVSTQIPITGNLFIPQPKESIVSSIWRQAANVVIREIDF